MNSRSLSRFNGFAAFLSRCFGLRRALGALAVFILGFSAQGAWAACNRVAGFNGIDFTLNLGTIYISPDLPVGSVIGSKRFTRVQATTTVATCASGGVIRYDILQGSAVSGFSAVYSTNVKGIGVRLTLSVDGVAAFTFPHVLNINPNTTAVLSPSSSYLVELIKTEPITGSGSIGTGLLARNYGDDGLSHTSITVPANGVTIVTPTCSVDAGSRNVVVQLGKVARNSFTGAGSTAGARPFNIQLNCSSGVAANNSVYLRMDATPDPSGQQGVIKLAQAANAATGVGIQILDKSNAAVRLGEDALVGPSKDGSYVLPYTARYYQTAPNVTAGPANGMATFTINYK